MKTEQIIQQLHHLPITGKSLAIGNDVVHLPTFLQSCTQHFISRVYTNKELEYCAKFVDVYLRYASTWAAKEAAYKAMKQVDENVKLWWRDIEIVRAKPGSKPTINIKKIKIPLEFSLSISHDKNYVWALAICLFQKK